MEKWQIVASSYLLQSPFGNTRQDKTGEFIAGRAARQRLSNSIPMQAEP